MNRPTPPADKGVGTDSKPFQKWPEQISPSRAFREIMVHGYQGMLIIDKRNTVQALIGIMVNNLPSNHGI